MTKLVKRALIALMFFGGPAMAQPAYPTKPVRLIVPFTAGGSTDILARLLAKGLEEKWGKPVVVENRPGGSTVIGGAAVANAPADGYMLMLGSDTTYAINPHTMAKMPFDPLKDLSPVTRIASAPNWIVVAENSPFKTFDDLVAKAKAPGNGVNVSVNSPNGYAHLALNAWIRKNGLNVSIIPYAGASRAVPDLMGGNLDGVVDVVGGTIGFTKDGKLRPLTILQSQPSLVLGGTLPFAGDAVRDLNVTTSFVLFTTGGTPPATLERIHEGVTQVMNQPAMKSRMDELALELVLSTPAETAEFTKAENARFKEIVANANLAKQ
ncbi:tripartite tricarboxylate transporter family receptor [Bordetella bronchiseptica 99-R-0433]|uniref:Bug family tripartite tricarboxylate transporter substrate binding protein n=1 Tax=Bordetella bronchiseptica TaxID=518 RepID=UPI00045B8691|nr:tripartite tricarboxylate transporter substrate binding protein [Bordetella bronchiseptica]KCV67057.1 tripartite tricarboxylate transporter family receptor [Bordetella bronchiseptica 99-R-0433]